MNDRQSEDEIADREVQRTLAAGMAREKSGFRGTWGSIQIGGAAQHHALDPDGYPLAVIEEIITRFGRLTPLPSPAP